MDSVTELLWLLGVLGLVGAVALAQRLYGVRRRRLLAEAASSIGFFPASDALPALPEMNLFSKGNGEAGYTNSLMGSAAGFETEIFDYWYEEGRGRSRHEVRQTVAAFHLPGANMPDFQILPRTVFRKIRAAFRRDDIDKTGEIASGMLSQVTRPLAR